MGKIIKNGISYGSAGSSGGSDIQVLTQEEYDALVTAGTVDENIYYFIGDEDENGEAGDNIPASYIGYDNSESELEATDIQGAVDEVNGRVDEISTDITELNQNMNAHLNNDGGIITAESLEKAVAILCDRCTTPKDTYMGTFIYNNYPYIYKIVYISVGDWMGEISKHSWDGSNPYAFVRTAGADAVLKKLGSANIKVITKVDLGASNSTNYRTAKATTSIYDSDGNLIDTFTASTTVDCGYADRTGTKSVTNNIEVG